MCVCVCVCVCVCMYVCMCMSVSNDSLVIEPMLPYNIQNACVHAYHLLGLELMLPAAMASDWASIFEISFCCDVVPLTSRSMPIWFSEKPMNSQGTYDGCLRALVSACLCGHRDMTRVSYTLDIFTNINT